MKAIISTEHLNLLYAKNAYERKFWWKLIIEEFAPTKIRHIIREDNDVANWCPLTALLRLGMESRAYDPVKTKKAHTDYSLQYYRMLHRIEDMYSLKEVIVKTLFSQAPKLIKEAEKKCDILEELVEEDQDHRLPILKAVKGIDLVCIKTKYISLIHSQ